MKKRIVLFPLFCLLATVGCLAQFTPNDSIRGKIREIKLSGAFVYAEASSMTNADEAQEVSLGKLEAGAISMMAENQMDKESIKNAWGKAKDKAVVMTYKNGTLFKVFSCLPKSALLGEPSAAEAMVVLTPPAGEKVLASLAPAEKPVADVPDSVAVSAGSEAVAPDVPEAVDSTLVADAVPAVEPVQVDTVAQVIVPKAAAPVNPLGEAAQATGQVYRGQTKSGEEALRDASTAQLIALLAQDSASEAKPEKADPAGEPERAGQPETG